MHLFTLVRERWFLRSPLGYLFGPTVSWKGYRESYS